MGEGTSPYRLAMFDGEPVGGFAWAGVPTEPRDHRGVRRHIGLPASG
jgi:hypothetical protein